MSAEVQLPTLLLAADRFGDAVLRQLDDVLGPLPNRMAVVSCTPAEIPGKLPAVLETLLRAGRAPSDAPDARLDVIAFASAEQSDLVPPCAALAQLLAEQYGLVFPADAPPAQRTARLHVVVRLPALGTVTANEALRRVRALEKWALDRPAHPLLARIWLVGPQTTHGTLTEDSVVISAAAFAIATVASGLRFEEPILERLAFPSSEGLVSLLSAAVRDLPVARIACYAADRAAYDALNRLVDRVARQSTDASVADGAVRELEPSQWMRPFEDGAPAQRCRRLTASLSGMEPALSPVKVGALTDPGRIRAAHADLFAPAAAGKAATAMDSNELAEVLKQLDQAENDALASFNQALDGVLERELAPGSGLAGVPELELGLKRLRDGLVDAHERELLTPPKVEDADPGRRELEEAYAGLPRPGLVWASAIAAGLAVMLLALAGIIAGRAPAGAGTASTAASQLAAPTVSGGVAPAGTAPPASTWETVIPWLIAAASGALGGLAWAWAVGKITRKRLKLALERRRAAMEELRALGGAGWGRSQGDFQLALRKHRLRRAGHRAVEVALAHVQAVRRQLTETRDGLRQALLASRVVLGPDGTRDDLTGLIGIAEQFCGPLVSPKALASFVAGCRETAEPDVWASRLLQGAWPAAAVLDDVPCADPAEVQRLGAIETAGLSRRSLFDDEGAMAAAAQAVRALIQSAPALAPVCRPRDAADYPVQPLRDGETLVLTPDPAREEVEVAERDGRFGSRARLLRVPDHVARVIVLRTWEGLTVEQVVLGAQRRAPTPA